MKALSFLRSGGVCYSCATHCVDGGRDNGSHLGNEVILLVCQRYEEDGEPTLFQCAGGWKILGFFEGGVEAEERGRFVSGEDIDVERRRDARTDVGILAGRVIARGLFDSRTARRCSNGLGDDEGRRAGEVDRRQELWRDQINCNLKKNLYVYEGNCPVRHIANQIHSMLAVVCMLANLC